MRKKSIALATLCLGACLGAPLAAAQDAPLATPRFLNTMGELSGTATLSPVQGGVFIGAEVGGLPPGKWVAFHIHENGECDHTNGFETAGGHFNPTDAGHGYYVENGPHAGDMPNQYVGEDGVMRSQIYNGFVTIGDGETDVMGRSLVIHAGPDDYTSQPSGNAGDRLACAVIE